MLACEICGLACLDATGTVCPRCFAAMHRRKPQSVARAAALALAGLVFYLPANLYPALTVIQLGSGSPSTILGGVWELAAASEWPLAIIVFLASAAVPVCKLLGLGAMVLAALRGGSRHLREMTVLYRILLAIGRWSMIDIFMESILGSLVQFGAIATIQPGGGAIAFAAVVVLTMLAAEAFDPRLMWDRALAMNEMVSIPEAHLHKRRMSWIWLIPLASLAIGGWLLWSTLSRRGPMIHVTFKTAEGLKVWPKRGPLQGHPARHGGLV